MPCVGHGADELIGEREGGKKAPPKGKGLKDPSKLIGCEIPGGKTLDQQSRLIWVEVER